MTAEMIHYSHEKHPEQNLFRSFFLVLLILLVRSCHQIHNTISIQQTKSIMLVADKDSKSICSISGFDCLQLNEQTNLLSLSLFLFVAIISLRMAM